MKRLPCIAFLLTSAVEPIKQASLYSVAEIIYSLGVVCYSVVMIVSNKHLVQFLDNLRQRQYPHLRYLPVNFPAFLCELLLVGSPLHPELPVPALGTVVCETQERKCLRLLSLFSGPFSGISPEFNQPALGLPYSLAIELFLLASRFPLSFYESVKSDY